MIAESEGHVMALEGVTVEVSGNILLEPLTMAFPDSGIVGLVGQNGSGKSTLLRVLSRQLAPTHGTIRFGGKPLKSWGERDFARKVAYLPQHTPLAAGLKVRELVALGRYPWHGALGLFRSVDREKVDEALTLTSTDVFADRLVDTLSGGERQRVWLAMLIAQDARLLLLDEPISALDVAHQLEVLALVRRLSQDKGIAVVVVIHEINLAARFCDEIVALKSGRLVAHGPPDEFMTARRLEEIYDVNMGVFPHPDTGESIAFVRTRDR
ncbi:MAG: ATP-binding cassette domain-containing protein [Vicinamibacterales bacterium]